MRLYKFITHLYIDLYLYLRVRFVYRKLFRTMRSLEFLAEVIVYKIHWNESQINLYSAISISQNLHRIKSLRLLLSRGLTADAWSVFRAEIESVLDFNYILKNPEKLDLYFQYSIHLDLKSIRRYAKARSLTPDQQKLYDDLNKEWDKYSHLFNQSGRGRIRQSWRDKTLLDLAKDAHMEDAYLSAYAEANDFVHGNSNLLQKFVVGKNQKSLLLKAGGAYEAKEIFRILAPSLNLFLFQLIVVNNKLDLGFNRELNKNLDFFKQLAKTG